MEETMSEEKEPKAPNKRQIIRGWVESVDNFTIDEIVELIGGTKTNASTTIGLLCREDKAGKLGPIPFTYDKSAKQYVRTGE